MFLFWVTCIPWVWNWVYRFPFFTFSFWLVWLELNLWSFFLFFGWAILQSYSFYYAPIEQKSNNLNMNSWNVAASFSFFCPGFCVFPIIHSIFPCRLFEMQPGISRISLLILPAFSCVRIPDFEETAYQNNATPCTFYDPKFSIMFACYYFATIEEIVPEKSSAISSQKFHDRSCSEVPICYGQGQPC